MAAVNVTFPGNLAQVDTADDLRAVPSSLLPVGLLYAVPEIKGLYGYDPGSTQADDNDEVIKPNDKTALQAGRWIRTLRGFAFGPPGSSSNTRADLAALKAADIADVTSLYDREVWTFESGNFTGLADDKSVAQSDGTPITTGAWVRSYADGTWLFSQRARLRIPAAYTRIRSAGWDTVGIGAADYMADAAVDATYVTAHPNSSFIGADGRGWRIASERLTVDMFGAHGNNQGDDTAGIQAAINECQVGSMLHFVPKLDVDGYYRVTSTINVTRRVSFDGCSAKILGFFTTETDLLSFRVANAGDADARTVIIRGFKDINFITGGRHTIYVTDGGGNVANIEWTITQNSMSGRAGYAIYLNGVGTHFCNIVENSIANGIYLACADNNRIMGNIIFGERTAITLDLVPGAFNTIIEGNGLVSRDGALRIIAGSQVRFHKNQIEQFLGYGANQSSHKASITVITGTAQDKMCRHLAITENNFGGGLNVERSIALVSGAQDTTIDGNVFNTAVDADIHIFDSTVKWTRIGPNNGLRGNRGGVVIDANGNASDNAGQGNGPGGAFINDNTLDPADLLRVTDNGLGTFGVWKGVTLGNGWTTTTDAAQFGFKKLAENVLVFRGRATAGTIAAGTLIGTLPEGFRPRIDTHLPAYDSVAAAPAYLSFNTGGEVRVASVAAAAVLNLDCVQLPIRGRANYTPGV